MPHFDTPATHRFALPRLVLSAPWRWLLFDFDDKTLARAFAHGAR